MRDRHTTFVTLDLCQPNKIQSLLLDLQLPRSVNFSGVLNIFGNKCGIMNSYPKKAVRVLSKDCMPPVVSVRVRHCLYPCPQQLIPQQGGIRHSVWMGGQKAERHDPELKH